jgi:hypothetical protein
MEKGVGVAGGLKGRAEDHGAGQRKEIPAISASFGRGRSAASWEEKEGGRQVGRCCQRGGGARR